ncbi:4'-phosphopantetheinyl transferase Npt [Nocardia sp. NPDC101769]|uniref:4'-phosphopantetheinyl transferase Npt n=1 Tax=Nocardia sp. NPDC101769 TaxID=3364333 RepID=UPI0038034F8A
MIETIFPAGIATAELHECPDDLKPHPAEEHLITRSVDKRRREFIGARHCARQALQQLGEPPVAIGKGERGAPVWPRGIVGSLTHCEGYQAAALAHQLRFRSVAIDAEPHEALPEGVGGTVALPPEQEWLHSVTSELHLDRLLFCAKETTYKAWFPLTKRWLGFEDAHITFTVDEDSGSDGAGTFHSRLLVPGPVIDGGSPLSSFDGRWKISSGLILTAITFN